MVEYGERLSEAMRVNGLSIRQLADKVGVTYQAIKKVVDGKSTALSAPNHVLAAQALGVSSEWLALGRGSMLLPDKNDRMLVKPETAQWPFGDFSRYESLSSTKKAQLAQIVEAFLAGAQEDKSDGKKTA